MEYCRSSPCDHRVAQPTRFPPRREDSQIRHVQEGRRSWTVSFVRLRPIAGAAKHLAVIRCSVSTYRSRLDMIDLCLVSGRSHTFLALLCRYSLDPTVFASCCSPVFSPIL